MNQSDFLVLGLGIGVLAIGGYLFLEARKNQPAQPPVGSPVPTNPGNQDAYDDWRRGERESYK